MKEYKLTFEFVPEECWRGSLYHLLPTDAWDKIRRNAYARAGYKCSMCGTRGKLEAHEKWEYDDERALQTLVDVIALCHRCHEVKHISRTYAVGRGKDAEEWFMQVNGCSQMEYHEALGKANEEYIERNKVEGWTTNFSFLEKFNNNKK